MEVRKRGNDSLEVLVNLLEVEGPHVVMLGQGTLHFAILERVRLQKQVGLAVSFRQLIRSKQLTTMLDQMRQCNLSGYE